MSNYRKDINDYIYGLNYDPQKILAFNGATVSDKNSKEGLPKDDKYYVIERKKCTLENDFDVSVPSLNQSITYPGALLIGDHNLVDGNPNAVGIKRGAVKLTMVLPGMTSGMSADIPCADYASVSLAINKILDKWYAQYPSYAEVPANMSYVSDLVYDEKTMQLKFGVDVSFIKNSLAIDFNAVKNKTKSVYVAKFKQIYYTAAVEPLSEPADAFADGTSVENLKRAGIENNTPPVYVGAVAYGREIYVKFESDLQSYELESLVKGHVSSDGISVDANVSEEIKEMYKRISCSLIAYGGGTENITGLFSDENKIKEINNYITSGVKLSKQNPASPLTYKSVFLKDNSTAKIHGTTEYMQEDVSVFNKGELSIEHNGVYVARFYINWQTIDSFDENGNPKYTDQSWAENGNKKTIGFQTVIPFDANVRNISIKAEGETGLVWDNWHTSFDRRNIALSPVMSFKVSGTTLNQKAEFSQNNT